MKKFVVNNKNWIFDEINAGIKRFTDQLTSVGVVRDFYVGIMFMDFGEKLLGGKTHGGYVVDSAFEFLARCVEELEKGVEAIFDVHHGQPRLGLEVTLVPFVDEAFVKNRYSVICNRGNNAFD